MSKFGKKLLKTAYNMRAYVRGEKTEGFILYDKTALKRLRTIQKSKRKSK